MSLDWLSIAFPDLQAIAPLGRGGQKQVYSAKHKTDGQVVLKLMLPGQDVETVRREILAAATVPSPRVPRLLAHGTVQTPVGPCIWIREARVDGKNLREALAAGPLLASALVRLALHILEALTAAEAARIVHRDIKPENIMQDGCGAFWLLDFGLARHLDLTSLTPTGLPLFKGTLGYCPPEQMRGLKRDIDARADLFGLGITIFEAATGSNPFRAGARDQFEILKRVERCPLPRLALKIPDADEFADLVEAMTQKRRDQRPGTAADTLAWIHEIAQRHGVR